MNKVKSIVPSQRAEGIKEYYFSKKLKEIAKLNASGADIISLGIGGPDLPPPSEAIEKACEVLQTPNAHGYQMTTGLPALRNAFSKWYAQWYGVELDADNEILPLIGSKEGCVHLALTFLNPGDGVLVPDPGYPTYTSASKLAGAEVFKYSLTQENDWLPDFEALEKLPLDKIKMMWVNYPHMPTGRKADCNVFEKIVDFGKRNGILIVNDNPYSFILNPNPLSILSVKDAEDVCLEMNSLSKCMNMAGWRVGMLAGNQKFISWVLKVKSNMDSGQPKAIMEGAIAALGATKQWYESLNNVYGARKKIAYKIMNALGCSCDSDQQGLFLWGRIPDSELNGEVLCDKILTHAKVFVTPGFIFGRNGEKYIRISLCATEDKLLEALDRINRSIDKIVPQREE